MKKWYSKEAEMRNKEVVQERCRLDQEFEIQRQYGGYTGPPGPTIKNSAPDSSSSISSDSIGPTGPARRT